MGWKCNQCGNRIGFSFSNFGSNNHPHAIKVREATRLVKLRRPDILIDGEMQADTAVSPDIVNEEFPFSEIKGDANVLAIVYAKAAEMADILKDSGSGVRPSKKGENGWKGGVIRKVPGGYILAAFSGSKSEDDVAISQIGVEVLSRSFGVASLDK